jgi:hypothetical protein
METPPVALQVKGSEAACRIAYASAAMAHPATLFALGSGIGLGLLAGSVIAGLTAVAVLVAVAWMVSTTISFRRMVDRRAEERVKVRRRQRREGRLTAAGIGRDALRELTGLVDDVERHDPQLARRYELEELLDHHVDVALTYERCVRAMRLADRNALVTSLSSPAAPAGRRGRLVQRRLRCWDQCRAEADHCVDELAATAELIRLLAQKAASPELRLDDEALERRLVDLEEEEAALEQLRAAR